MQTICWLNTVAFVFFSFCNFKRVYKINTICHIQAPNEVKKNTVYLSNRIGLTSKLPIEHLWNAADRLNFNNLFLSKFNSTSTQYWIGRKFPTVYVLFSTIFSETNKMDKLEKEYQSRNILTSFNRILISNVHE